MHSQNLIYGVFKEFSHSQQALAQLKKAGLKGASVVVEKNKPVEFNSAKVSYPIDTYFKVFGAIGALIGAIAGAIATPTLLMMDVFEVLTPVMAATGGAALGGYFGILICAFLHTSQKPEFHLHRYEGVIENGIILVSVKTDSNISTAEVFDCFITSEAVEVIVRNCDLDLLVKNPDNLTAVKTETTVALESAA